MRTSDEDKVRTSHVLLFAPVSSLSKKHTDMLGNFPRHCGGLSNSLSFSFFSPLTPLHPGRVSFFSSGSENLHRVEKVTWGTRYAITVSFTCDPEHAIADPALPAGNWEWRQLVDDNLQQESEGTGKKWVNKSDLQQQLTCRSCHFHMSQCHHRGNGRTPMEVLLHFFNKDKIEKQQKKMTFVFFFS